MNIKYYQANVLSVILCLFLLIVGSFYFISDVEEDKIKLQWGFIFILVVLNKLALRIASIYLVNKKILNKDIDNVWYSYIILGIRKSSSLLFSFLSILATFILFNIICKKFDLSFDVKIPAFYSDFLKNGIDFNEITLSDVFLFCFLIVLTLLIDVLIALIYLIKFNCPHCHSQMSYFMTSSKETNRSKRRELETRYVSQYNKYKKRVVNYEDYNVVSSYTCFKCNSEDTRTSKKTREL